MTLAAWQANVADWHQRTFGACPPEVVMLKLTEEVGEVAAAIHEDCYRRDDRTQIVLADELADTLIALLALASRAGIDMQFAIQRRFPPISQRQYERVTP